MLAHLTEDYYRNINTAINGVIKAIIIDPIYYNLILSM